MLKADILFSGVSFGGNLEENMKKKKQKRVRLGISPKDCFNLFAALMTSSHRLRV